MLLGSVAALVVAVGGVLVAGYLLVDIPRPREAAAAQANVWLYADGSPLARTGEVNRENVSLERVPEHVRWAVLAAEDRDFYTTSAIDPKGVVRAGWRMLRGEARQSGSTITQQYVKNYYLDQRQTLSRKSREFFISVKLDREVSKDEILAGYLNTSYFGRGAYGIQAAARAYYDKDVEELGVGEGAYLAALLNAPSLYDVRVAPERRDRALARWGYVLDGMVSRGWLTASERAAITFPEPGVPPAPSGLSGQRGYLVEAARAHLLASGTLDEQRLAAGGFRITTTFEPDKQEALVEAVAEELLERLSPDRPQDATLRAGAASVEPDTGRVVAMYGGVDYTVQYLNNATRRDYQAASTFKPFVYAAAREHGAVTRAGVPIGPYTPYDGTSGRPVVGRDGVHTGWAPANERDTDHGTVTVGRAMDLSVNSVFAQLGVDVGPELVRDTAIALGLPEETPGLAEAEGSISLGTATPSALDLAGAYATLAARGERRPMVLVDSVTRDGRPVGLPRSRSERAVSRAAADSTTAILRGVVESGTGTAALAAGRPAAGKTGTAEQDKAAWFAGYTPELATVVGVLGQDPVSGAQVPMYGALGEERISGGGVPARIWARYTESALAGQPVRDFEPETGRADVGPRESAPAVPADGGPREDEEAREEESDGGPDGDDGEEPVQDAPEEVGESPPGTDPAAPPGPPSAEPEEEPQPAPDRGGLTDLLPPLTGGGERADPSPAADEPAG
ncbi:transglycosylase domain-containing protein [Streptomyces sp. ST2-7A]|uniref:transglycosylase domain-containing protein n=1 Tax=Streptomyces sp. ST2-7A TaxID=2907214 RepID=UPI001F3446C4|nr:transglycosylase domain-containing protein [Streptomyces sp. ST2-7A]MCE7081911.1 penicillin-binding protein [Streptomyces sp. ST2-7A]